MFDSLPLWTVFSAAVLLVLGSIRTGYALARWLLRRASNDAIEAPVGSVVGAVLGLLAFMLAFTFGNASSRYDQRKQLLLHETEAIGTAFLRAELLPEATCDEAQQLLREYVADRIVIPDDRAELERLLRQAEQMQAQLWQMAKKLTADGVAPPLVSLFISALNEVFDAHTSRTVVALQDRIPDTIWFGLIAIACLAMATLGYQFGLLGKANTGVSLLLALAFSAAITLIADLDRVSQGTLRVSQQPMVDLQRQLGPSRR